MDKDLTVSGFSVRPYGGNWLWFLYVDGCVMFRGKRKHELTALFCGCCRWAWYNLTGR